MRRTIDRWWLLLVVCAMLLTPAARAATNDTWSDPFAGVRYQHRTVDEPKYDIHLVFVDLTNPGIKLLASTQEERGMSTNQWAMKRKVQIAINGGMGGFRKKGYHQPWGLSMGDGKLWTDVMNEGAHARFGSFAEGGGRIAFYEPGILAKPEPWMRNILIGTAVMIRDGKPNPDMTDLPRMRPRHPRTAIAATKDMKTLMLLVVDGRQKHSIGMTATDMQKLFMEFDAWTALNFDGGGSSCLYMEGKGVLNKPSDGRPRRVTNHLGVFSKERRAE